MDPKTISQKAAGFANKNPGASLEQAWLDGYNTALKSKARKKKTDLSFADQDFAPVMAKWLQYKSERKQSYTQMGAESCYKRLIELSGGNKDVAMRIVEQSISNNWAGLYELKSTTTTSLQGVGSNRGFQSADGRKVGVGQLADLAEGVLRGLGGNFRR